MTPPELKKAVQDILPQLIAEDPAVRDFVLRTVSNYYDSREATESKFDRVLAELQRDREDQSRKWDEPSHRWNEQHQHNQETLAELQTQNRRYESSIGAIGARWGRYSEESFRSALKGILEESFGGQVLNINDFDEAGEVFGRPDQVELDIVITNGSVIACEIKSSLSKSDMYSFDRKVAFYQKRHERPVGRKLVISPMVDEQARPVSEALGIEVYSSPQSMPGYRYGSADSVL